MLNVENISLSRITVASHLTASDFIWCPVIEDLLYTILLGNKISAVVELYYTEYRRTYVWCNKIVSR